MTATPKAKHPEAHYDWGDGCEGWHLVRTATLSVIEERMPGGTSEVRHRHARARQFFYVLHGVLTVEVDGVPHQVAARSGLEILPGAVHQVFNRSGEDVEFLVVSEPPSHGDKQTVNREP